MPCRAFLWIGLLVTAPAAPLPADQPKAQPSGVVGSVLGNPLTAEELGLTARIDPSLRFDARDRELWGQMKRIQAAFGGPILERFTAERKIVAEEEEVARFQSAMLARYAAEQPGDRPPPDREALAEIGRAVIAAWKVERELHRVYGGRVVFQQAGAEAVDARRRLFEEAEQAGDLGFEDPGVRHLFYYYFTMRFFPAGKDAFERPWFFEEPAEQP